ncbi:16S rRNA (guanine(527)-N(7))-methyltransferase RsmG [Aquibium microcysteis]|uniref:16S rRNA (guanine(527)-N(7))-methyltransferase RsmG n=1 Tax=Aquibium microcysteis TaxID=675281 RepID=UPI001EF334E9|nr:16S rRNA (guanine(527)-N(7))-methyltransferase RsmG [Aquibium microcysteis]
MSRYEALCAVAGPVSRETFDKLLAFETIFRKWAARINLAAPSTLSELWTRHILDSAQLLSLARDAKRWADIGSGGGFPGAIMAILLNDQLDSSIILIESNGKKAAFLRNVLADLAGRARIAPERAETVISAQPAPDVVTARAVAPLRDLLTLTEPWMEAGTRALFHKGRDFRSEVKSASDTWNLDLVEHRSAVDPLSVVLEIDRIRRV